MNSQKDWVIFDLAQGNMFRVSIIKHSGARGRRSRRRNSTWYLVRYLNFFKLDPGSIEDFLVKEYSSMLDASSSKEVKDHSYILAHHTFKKEDMSPNYWKGMLKRNGRQLTNVDIQGIKIPINKKRFEEEMYRLLEGPQ